MVIEKGQLLSYAFAEFGTENDGGELIAKEDLVVTPRDQFPRFVKFGAPNPLSCYEVVLMRAHVDADGNAAAYATAGLKGYYRFSPEEIRKHDVGATDADIDAFITTAVDLYRRDEPLRVLRSTIIDALVQSEKRGGFREYPPLPEQEKTAEAARPEPPEEAE